jgi:hypothetical protein
MGKKIQSFFREGQRHSIAQNFGNLVRVAFCVGCVRDAFMHQEPSMQTKGSATRVTGAQQD